MDFSMIEAIIFWTLMSVATLGFVFLCVFTIWQHKKLTHLEGYMSWYYQQVIKQLKKHNEETNSQLARLQATCEKQGRTLEQHNENIQSRIIKLHTTTQSNDDDFKVRLESLSSAIKTCVNADKKEVISTLIDSMNSLYRSRTEINSKNIESLKSESTILLSTLNKLIAQEQEHYSRMSHGVSDMTSIWKKHLETLQPFEELLHKTKDLYQNIKQEEESLSKQEESVLSAVEKQAQIAQLTYELNQTSKDIYELMRLYLMNSIVEYSNNKV